MAPSTAALDVTARGTPIPRGEKRRREIATVAARVFFAHGFTDTTMQTIAAEAGASKETLYRHFGSKEGLFSEVIEARSEAFIERLDENFQRSDATAVLRELGIMMLEKMTDPEGLALCRMVIAEAPRSPELGRIFFERGPQRVRDRLALFLAAAAKRGTLACADPELAARMFLGAVLSFHHITRLMLMDCAPLGKAEAGALVEEAVTMFTRHYRSSPESGA